MSNAMGVPREASLELLDPALRPGLGSLPTIFVSAATLASARAEGNAIRLDYPGEISRPVDRSEVTVQSSDGYAVRTILHRPRGLPADAPALLHVHGGGMVMGLPEVLDQRNEVLASRYGCVIATPDYRKAPEAPGPAGARDCLAVLRWLEEGGASADGAAPVRIVAAGESGGGGIVAACALMDRDEGRSAISALMLLAPMLDDRTGREVAASGPYGDFVWPAENNEFCWDAMRAGSDVEDAISSYVSPSRETSLAGMPPTFVAVGQLDLFAKEATEFALRLSDAYVPTELHLYSRAPHGFTCAHGTPVAQRAWADFESFLERALRGDV